MSERSQEELLAEHLRWSSTTTSAAINKALPHVNEKNAGTLLRVVEKHQDVIAQTSKVLSAAALKEHCQKVTGLEKQPAWHEQLHFWAWQRAMENPDNKQVFEGWLLQDATTTIACRGLPANMAQDLKYNCEDGKIVMDFERKRSHIKKDWRCQAILCTDCKEAKDAWHQTKKTRNEDA